MSGGPTIVKQCPLRWENKGRLAHPRQGASDGSLNIFFSLCKRRSGRVDHAITASKLGERKGLEGQNHRIRGAHGVQGKKVG